MAGLRALRAVIVIPALFALTFKGFGDLQMALFAAFGGFANLVMVSFGGSKRDKLVAHFGLGVIGSIGLIIGTAVHGIEWLAVLVTIESDGLLANAAAIGRQLSDGIAGISHPLLAGVRGHGLWLAALLTQDAAGDVEAAARRAGFLVNPVQPDAIRLAPPLILSAAEAESFVSALPSILNGAD